jgi:TatA/E family protein of Tat protein translocase
MGPLGFPETVFIFVLALLLFGPKKLPELGRNFGKALTEFRRASNDLKSTFDREMANLERETADVRAEAGKIGDELKSSISDSSYNYDYNHYYDSGYDGYQPHDAAGSSESTGGASATQGADPAATSSSVEAASADRSPGVEGTVAVETAPQRPSPEVAQPEPSRQTA